MAVDTRHIKIYDDYFDLGEQDFKPCEILGDRGVDVHHIFGRIQNEYLYALDIHDPNDIRNLMRVSRSVHEICGQSQKWNAWLFENHIHYIKTRTPLFERNPFDSLLIELIRDHL